MVDEITSNPKRSDPIVNSEGLPTKQTIEWFDDIELKINEIVNEPSSGGGFNGPNGAVPQNLVSFADATGDLGEDSGVPSVDVVTGPSSAGNDNIAVYDNLTGKLIKDSGINISSLGTGDVVGPGGAVDDRIATFDGATGKLIKDSGNLISDLGDVKGPGSAVNENIAVYDSTTGKLIKDSGVNISSVGAGGGGAIAQVAFAQFSASLTSASIMPLDDTIPVSSSGVEVMTLNFTPEFSDSTILIEVIVLAHDDSHGWAIALFRDSINDALSAAGVSTVDSLETLSLTFSEPAVDVVARTYKVRAGVIDTLALPPSSFTFNGKDLSRVFGNIPKSSIKITEIRA